MEEEKSEILKFRDLLAYEYYDALNEKLSKMYCNNLDCFIPHLSEKKSASQMCFLEVTTKGQGTSFIINSPCCNHFKKIIKHEKDMILNEYKQYIIV